MVEITKIGNKTLVMDGKILSLFRKGSLLRQMYYGGYEDFDGANGGVWKKYINIPIKTVPLEYAQYIIEIDDTNVSVYNAEGTLKAQSSIASEFWSLVRSDGNDIRVFDHLFNQLWFWVEKFDYTNQVAKIFVRLPENSEELNIAFGNEKAFESSYNSAENTLEVFDDFEDADIGDWEWSGGNLQISTDAYQGNYSLDQTVEALGNYHARKLKQVDLTDFVFEMAGKNYEGVGSITWAMVFSDWADGQAVDGYTWYIHPSIDKVRMTVETDGSHTDIDIGSYTSEYNTWYYGKWIKKGSSHKFWVNGSFIGEVTESTYTRFSYVGLQLYRQCRYDIIKVYKLADPATFDTPKILEF